MKSESVCVGGEHSCVGRWGEGRNTAAWAGAAVPLREEPVPPTPSCARALLEVPTPSPYRGALWVPERGEDLPVGTPGL